MSSTAIVLTLAFGLGAVPVTPDNPAIQLGTESALTNMAERVILPVPEVTVRVDALRETLDLSVKSGADALYKSLHAGQSAICPTVEKTADGVRLRCITRQLAARVSRSGSGGTSLDIRRLRGLPMKDGEELPIPYVDPPDFYWGDACPGSKPIGRAECALHAGDLPKARQLLVEAFDTIERSGAACRLGELAVKDGKYDAALVYFRKAGSAGPFGRLARVHVCELTGSCLGNIVHGDLFDLVGLPEPVRTDIERRALRLRFYTEDPEGPALDLLARMADTSRPNPCTAVQPWCEQMVQFSLETLTNKGAALGLFLQLQKQAETPLGFKVVSAAADAAAQVGAPDFGANLLASASPRVPGAQLNDHLLRTAQLYIAAEDRTRADVIVTFARQKLGAAAMAQAPWLAVQRSLREKKGKGRGEAALPAALKLAPDSQEDLAAAHRAISQSRVATEESR